MDDLLYNASIFVMLLGLALALPNLDSVILDFSNVSEEIITLLRLGIMSMGLAVLARSK